MKYAVIMIPLLLLSSAPACAEWVEIKSESFGGTTVYVDPDTIRRKGNLVKMWTFRDMHPIQPNDAGNPSASIKEQRQFDCEEERSRVLYSSFLAIGKGKGEVFTFDSGETEWEPVQPRSMNEAFWRLACGKQ